MPILDTMYMTEFQKTIFDNLYEAFVELFETKDIRKQNQLKHYICNFISDRNNFLKFKVFKNFKKHTVRGCIFYNITFGTLPEDDTFTSHKYYRFLDDICNIQNFLNHCFMLYGKKYSIKIESEIY